ncbi:MAG: hypothetical protein ABR915_15795 [Thermoguttaceae bacterium]
MSRKPVSPKAIVALVAAGLVLPIVISVLLALAELLAVMGDVAGGIVLRYLALAGGIGWILVLVCLLLAQGLNALTDSDKSER